jgi:hypothetical protein
MQIVLRLRTAADHAKSKMGGGDRILLRENSLLLTDSLAYVINY